MLTVGAISLVGIVGEAKPVFRAKIDGRVEEDRLTRGDVPVFPRHAVVIAAAEVECSGHAAAFR